MCVKISVSTAGKSVKYLSNLAIVTKRGFALNGYILLDAIKQVGQDLQRFLGLSYMRNY